MPRDKKMSIRYLPMTTFNVIKSILITKAKLQLAIDSTGKDQDYSADAFIEDSGKIMIEIGIMEDCF